MADLVLLSKKLKWLMLGLVMAPLLCAGAEPEERFDVLQVGTQTYNNVTITTKAKDYIFITHSAGMSNVKISELTPETREKLGYMAEAPVEGTQKRKAAMSAWAKQAMAKVDVPQLQAIGAVLKGQGGTRLSLPWAQLVPLLAIFLGSYLLFCYCSMLICQKTGNEPGVLVWIPILQMIPLLRAAGMSPGWFFAFLLPLVNVIGLIVWALNIAQARNKSAWVALFLILPVTNLLAFLYLAFSSGTPRREPRRVEIMSLEVA